MEEKTREKKARIRLTIKFALLVALYWSIVATYGGYMITFGLDRGYAESIVSIAGAVYMICVFTGQFFWGSICDKKRTIKKVFIVGIVVAACAQLLMYAIDQVALYAILYGLYGFAMGPMGTIVDTWMLKAMNYNMKTYGISRGFGSAMYAVTTLITGYMIKDIGYVVMPILSMSCVGATLLLVFITKDAEFDEGEGEKGKAISTKDILSIMRIPSYVILLIVVFMIGMANSPVNSLKIVVLESVGGNVSTLGLDSFWGCLLQFVLFEIAGLLTVIPAKIRLFIAACAMMVAMGIDFVASAPWMVIVGTLFMNLHYSFLMPAMREMIMRIVDAKYQTTANGLADAFYNSMSGALSLLYAGTIAQIFGAKWMVFVSLCITLIPVVLLLWKRKEL